MKTEKDYKAEAKKMVRVAMVQHDVTYKDLSERMEKVGHVESEGALRNKISRGSFSAAFMLMVMELIESKV